MLKNILYLIIFIIVLVGVWVLLETYSPKVDQEPVITPSPVVEGNSKLEQELDASLQEDIDSEFKSIDENASKL